MSEEKATPRARARGLDELERMLAGDSAPLVVDVREPVERSRRPFHGALALPWSELESLDATELAERLPERGAEIMIVCARGTRSAKAAEHLLNRGYGRVDATWMGIEDWDEAQRARGAELHPRLGEPEAIERFARHLGLAEIGRHGQSRLLRARVLVVGAGGLGCPAALYLASAGVGTLTIADFDRVELSNLQRQILHGASDVGTLKVDSAERALHRLDPGCEVDARVLRVDADNARALCEGHDVVLDGSDDLATRYALSDAAGELGIPLVHASVHRFDGQLTLFDPARGGPCYRCMHPVEPPRGLYPSCSAGGVLGVLPGLLGVLQATEALKLLLGVGRSMLGRFLIVDALELAFHEFDVPPLERCRCAAWRRAPSAAR
jgi:sulfur-carrier protein adenylyltransferase/sulfurtransferase